MNNKLPTCIHCTYIIVLYDSSDDIIIHRYYYLYCSVLVLYSKAALSYFKFLRTVKKCYTLRGLLIHILL